MTNKKNRRDNEGKTIEKLRNLRKNKETEKKRRRRVREERIAPDEEPRRVGADGQRRNAALIVRDRVVREPAELLVDVEGEHIAMRGAHDDQLRCAAQDSRMAGAGLVLSRSEPSDHIRSLQILSYS